MASELRTTDGLKLHTRRWSPSRAAIGRIVLVHGLGEHSGRYAHVGERLAAAGFEVFAYDHRGHGRSAGPRGHAPRYDRLLDDLDAAVDHANEAGDYSTPLVLYGHSMGGGLVLNHALRRDGTIAGVIATSPLLATTDPPPSWLAWCAKRLSAVYPRFQLSAGIDPDDLARDPRVAADYLADPLTLRKLTARMAVEILTAGRWAADHAHQLATPTLLLHGDADRITSFTASAAFADSAGDTIEFVPWPGMRHELHWDDCRGAALEKIVAWLDRLPSISGRRASRAGRG